MLALPLLEPEIQAPEPRPPSGRVAVVPSAPDTPPTSADEAAVAMAKLQSVGALLELAETGSDGQRECATATLSALSLHEASRDAIAQAGGVGTLVRLANGGVLTAPMEEARRLGEAKTIAETAVAAAAAAEANAMAAAAEAEVIASAATMAANAAVEGVEAATNAVQAAMEVEKQAVEKAAAATTTAAKAKAECAERVTADAEAEAAAAAATAQLAALEVEMSTIRAADAEASKGLKGRAAKAAAKAAADRAAEFE